MNFRRLVGQPLLLVALLVLLLTVGPVVAHAQSVSIDMGAAGQAGATGRLDQRGADQEGR